LRDASEPLCDAIIKNPGSAAAGVFKDSVALMSGTALKTCTLLLDAIDKLE
jgi:hypothetical protein